MVSGIIVNACSVLVNDQSVQLNGNHFDVYIDDHCESRIFLLFCNEFHFRQAIMSIYTRESLCWVVISGDLSLVLFYSIDRVMFMRVPDSRRIFQLLYCYLKICLVFVVMEQIIMFLRESLFPINLFCYLLDEVGHNWHRSDWTSSQMCPIRAICFIGLYLSRNVYLQRRKYCKISVLPPIYCIYHGGISYIIFQLALNFPLPRPQFALYQSFLASFGSLSAIFRPCFFNVI